MRRRGKVEKAPRSVQAANKPVGRAVAELQRGWPEQSAHQKSVARPTHFRSYEVELFF